MFPHILSLLTPNFPLFALRAIKKGGAVHVTGPSVPPYGPMGFTYRPIGSLARPPFLLGAPFAIV